MHLAHETGAWNLGLAACFLGVALLPRPAAGALPFLLPFTAVLAWVSVGDLGAGHVHAGRAVGHLLLLGGALLVSALALRAREPGRGPLDAVRGWTRRLPSPAGRDREGTTAYRAAVRAVPTEPVAEQRAA